jgi:hypothetical protein
VENIISFSMGLYSKSIASQLGIDFLYNVCNKIEGTKLTDSPLVPFFQRFTSYKTYLLISHYSQINLKNDQNPDCYV